MRFFTFFRITSKKLFFSISPFLVFTVTGKSMEPTISSGHRVLACRFGTFNTRDIVIIKDPGNGQYLLKRIKQKKDDLVFVEGDNKKESTDSRNFGWISKDSIIAKVWYPYR